MESLRNHIEEQIQVASYCIVPFQSIERCWPIRLSDAETAQERDTGIRAYAKTQGWAVEMNIHSTWITFRRADG